MYHYICEYCKSRLSLRATSCHNCGAPVPYTHPATNIYGNPRFAQNEGDLEGGAYTEAGLRSLWSKRRAQENTIPGSNPGA